MHLSAHLLRVVAVTGIGEGRDSVSPDLAGEGDSPVSNRSRLAIIGGVLLVVLMPVVPLLLVAGYGGPIVIGGSSDGGEPEAPPPDRTVDAYAGYGTWVDVYDYAPSYQSGGDPVVTPEDTDDMASLGVETIYIQAAMHGPRSPDPLVDEDVLSAFVVRAREAGMRVVGWYLPRFDDLDADLVHLQAIAEFEVDGHRFDGVAVDIEWTQSVPDHDQRSQRLVELSQRLREAVPDSVLGAIVFPPVQTEVISPNLWPGFPWQQLKDYYDVWLPMGYWTERTEGSGYRSSRAYTQESTERLRANLDDPDVPVHPIGGIGYGVTRQDIRGFRRALNEVGAIGGSMYDWATLPSEMWEELAEGL